MNASPSAFLATLALSYSPQPLVRLRLFAVNDDTPAPWLAARKHDVTADELDLAIAFDSAKKVAPHRQQPQQHRRAGGKSTVHDALKRVPQVELELDLGERFKNYDWFKTRDSTFQRFGFDLRTSNKLPLNRTLGDYRGDACKRVTLVILTSLHRHHFAV
jgi:hypothetical protein